MLNKMDRGVSLYLTVIIMSILLAIVLGLSAILVGQIKMIKGMENSVVAFYAADTGIEDALYPDRANPTCNCPGAGSCTKAEPCLLNNGAGYYVEREAGGESGDCDASLNFCIKSVGTYQKTKRAIEISY